MIITKQQLGAVLVTASTKSIDLYYDDLAEQMALAHIDTPLRIGHFLTQIGHETGDLRAVKENLDYSARQLIAQWPRLFTVDNVANYAHMPERIANRAYGGRYGNGDEQSGDGWRFRGRGLLQLTFKGNYLAYGNAMGMDFLSNPDAVAMIPKWCVGTGIWYFTSHNLLPLCDSDDLVGLRRRVNGGLIGLEDCQKRITIAKQMLA